MSASLSFARTALAWLVLTQTAYVTGIPRMAVVSMYCTMYGTLVVPFDVTPETLSENDELPRLFEAPLSWATCEMTPVPM